MFKAIYNTWQRASLWGSHHYDSEQAIRSSTVSNQVILFFNLLTLALVFVIVFIHFFVLLPLNPIFYENYIYYYLLPAIVNIISLTTGYIIKNRYGYHRSVLMVIFVIGALYISFYSIMLGKATSYYFYLIAMVPLPFFALRRENRWSILAGIVYLLILLVGCDLYLQNNRPLVPAPPVIENFLHQAILVATFGTIGLICYYFWDGTLKAEEQIIESRKNLRLKDEQIQLELNFASDIQKGILPVERNWREIMFEVAYFPKEKVSGDYYDIFQFDDRIYILIADISGHGIPAALVTMVAKQTFSNLVAQKLGPAEIMKKANAHLFETIKTQDYLTAILLMIDLDYNLTYCNAGHCQPFRFSQKGNGWDQLKTGGTVVGLVDDTHVDYIDQKFKLGSGDRLVLFTDGLVDQKNKAGREFDSENLLRILHESPRSTSPALVQKIMSSVHNFREGRPVQDDMTLMILGRNLF